MKENNIYCNLSYNKSKIIVQTLNSNKISISTSIINYNQLYNIAKIMCITTNDINNPGNVNKLNIYKKMNSIIQLNLNLINKSKLEEYRERIISKYPDIICIIDNKINILTNMLNKIKKDRDEYIAQFI